VVLALFGAGLGVGFGVAGGSVLAGDPPPPAPPGPAAPPPAKRVEVEEVAGIRWERDFQEGLRRAAREGRPVFLAVNATEQGERANEWLWREAYPSKAWGDASRPFVCFVGNGNAHEEKVLADGTTVCSRYGVGTCACHKAALDYVMTRFDTQISPSHYVLEPDGAAAWEKSYYTQDENPPFLDRWASLISPRIVQRRVWNAREAKMASLAKAAPDALRSVAEAWLAENDALAAAGLVAALDQETDPARRKALMGALEKSGVVGKAMLVEDVEQGTSAPAAAPEDALAWVGLATAIDRDFGAWAACRVIARSKDDSLRGRAAARLAGAKDAEGFDWKNLPPPVAARVAEARVLAGDAKAAEVLAKGDRTAVGDARVARALAKAGAPDPTAALLKDLLAPGASTRNARRAALSHASAAAVKDAIDAVRKALADPAAEVRVAAAVALRRAGDASGASVVLAALADPVEGPDAHEALVAWHGSDLGDEPEAWEQVVRGGAGGGK
jgi:hypothetical protein